MMKLNQALRTKNRFAADISRLKEQICAYRLPSFSLMSANIAYKLRFTRQDKTVLARAISYPRRKEDAK